MAKETAPLYSVTEAAPLAGVSTRTLYRLIDEKLVPYGRAHNGRIRLTPQQIDEVKAYVSKPAEVFTPPKRRKR